MVCAVGAFTWRSRFFLCWSLALWCGCERSQSTDVPEKLPEGPLNAIRLLDLDDRPLEIHPQDHPATVLLFTRTDCPISNRYAPTIQRLCNLFSVRGVVFYLVYVDPHQPIAEIAAHLKAYNYPCAAVRDLDHGLVHQVGASITPEAVAINSQGQVVYRGRIDNRFVAFGKSRQEPTREDLSLALEKHPSGNAVEMPATRAIGCFIADLKE